MKQIAFAMAMVVGASGAQAADFSTVYEMAVRNDPTIAAAAATRDANSEAEPIARSQLLPFVALSGDARYNYQDVNKSVAGSYNDNFADGETGIQVGDTVVIGQKIKQDIKTQRTSWPSLRSLPI